MLRNFSFLLIIILVLVSCRKDETSGTGKPHIRPITANSIKYIDKVYEFVPAPGQFVNEGIANEEAPQKIVGGINAILNLGGYGGYVIAGFDHSILNKEGYDLAIYGNPIAPPTEWSEPGIVMVSQDVNGNALPDDQWYELAGSEYHKAGTKKKYSITYYNPHQYANVPWRDSEGNNGEMPVNDFHQHNYYPGFIAAKDSVTFTGTLLRSTLGILEGTELNINTSFSFGYADSWSDGDQYAEKNYNSFDIDWAVDERGQSIKLEAIDFIKVYTAQREFDTPVGEVSTEVRGAMDLHMP